MKTSTNAALPVPLQRLVRRPPELWDAAMKSRQDAIERGLDEKERYYRGVLDGLRAADEAGAWRDPQSDPPSMTGKILVWINDVGPTIVNVEERWMCFWDGHDETEPTDPSEWDKWREILPPNSELSQREPE